MIKKIYLVVVEDKFKPYIDSHFRDEALANARRDEINQQSGSRIASVQAEDLSV